MELEWRNIIGLEELYEVSNYGDVRSKDRKGINGMKLKGKDKKLSLWNNGYMITGFTDKTGFAFKRLVHILVANAFLPKVDGKYIVNHIDGNKLNNRVDNLEWCTQQDNIRHAYDIGLIPKGECHFKAKLTVKQVEYIKKVYTPYHSEFGCNPLARRFNVVPKTIRDLLQGKNWKSTS